MTSIESVTLEVPDPAADEAFYAAAFGLGGQVRVRAAQAATVGFRGFTLSLVVSQPGTVDSLIGTALAGGATTLKAAAKSFWGYGGVVQDPGGAIWKIATSSKKNTGQPSRDIDGFVLLLGVGDVKAAKQFYIDRGLSVAKSFGSKYVEFDTPSSPIKLALYSRRAAAKDAGVPAEGTGSHRIVIGSDAGPFIDPAGGHDGTWGSGPPSLGGRAAGGLWRRHRVQRGAVDHRQRLARVAGDTVPHQRYGPGVVAGQPLAGGRDGSQRRVPGP
jgi:hypothetical protein